MKFKDIPQLRVAQEYLTSPFTAPYGITATSHQGLYYIPESHFLSPSKPEVTEKALARNIRVYLPSLCQSFIISVSAPDLHSANGMRSFMSWQALQQGTVSVPPVHRGSGKWSPTAPLE
jgi:hypothetical protein